MININCSIVKHLKVNLLSPDAQIQPTEQTPKHLKVRSTCSYFDTALSNMHIISTSICFLLIENCSHCYFTLHSCQFGDPWQQFLIFLFVAPEILTGEEDKPNIESKKKSSRRPSGTAKMITLLWLLCMQLEGN